MQPFVVPLTLLAIVLLALWAGNHVSRSYRMPDSGWKVSLILALFGISAVILWTSWPPKQGIDLKGGVILIYEVDENLTRQVAQKRDATDTDPSSQQATAADDSQVDMPALIQALSRRINPGGIQEIIVRRYGVRQVEIIIPDVSSQEVERIKKVITTGGFLRFMIVANQRDHGHIWELADDPQQAGQYEIKDSNGNVVAQWAKLALDPKTSTEDNPVYRFTPEGAKTRLVRGRKEVLVVVNPDFNLQGSHLASVSKSFQDVSPCVSFRMTSTGAGLMRGLTATNLPDITSGHYSLLGIVMDGELISAPRIKETISGDGIIEGRFTDEEVDLLVNVLRAGRLPAVLRENPISQDQISPLLGNDTIRQGKISIYVSLMAVLGFMLIYYRFAGLVACVALLFNLMLILAVMIFIGAAFSLPGMAGLVLTVGMSVDANVLIYERIREELSHGATLRMAIRNGFARAMSAIVDSNITTLITAIVLYLVGTEQLRAFAVTLILGIIMCLFTGVFCSHVFMEIAERRRWITNLTMMKWLAAPDLNLFNMRWPAIIFSLIVIGIGLGAVLVRGRQVLDIDFLGGTSIQLLLKKDQALPIAQVRQRVDGLRGGGGTGHLGHRNQIRGTRRQPHLPHRHVPTGRCGRFVGHEFPKRISDRESKARPDQGVSRQPGTIDAADPCVVLYAARGGGHCAGYGATGRRRSVPARRLDRTAGRGGCERHGRGEHGAGRTEHDPRRRRPKRRQSRQRRLMTPRRPPIRALSTARSTALCWPMPAMIC